MSSEKTRARMIKVNYPVNSEIKTVQDMIDNLALCKMDDLISVAPFTIGRVKDRVGRVDIELVEIQGQHYEIIKKIDQ